MSKINGKKIVALIAMLAVVACSMAMLVACKDDNIGTNGAYNNDTDALVFSTQELDKVFNPFFSTSATDSNIVGLTQISMLSNTKDGKVAYGDNEAVVVKDLYYNTVGTQDVDQTTTYYFVLKNNVRFSNGSYLTIKDVLFNMYVYLDPAYTGSSTMYSTDIVGLKRYRTQAESEQEQDAYKARFEAAAETRINALVTACEEILEQDKYIGAIDTDTALLTAIGEYAQENDNAYLVSDLQKALELFKEELNNDYSNSMDSYEDLKFTDSKNNVHSGLFTTDVEVFLYNEGYISWNKKDNEGNGKLTSALTSDDEVDTLKSWTKEQAINTVYADKVPSSIVEIISYWNTSVTLNEYLTNLSMEEYYKANGNEIKNISGIEFANMTEAVTVNGTVYDVPVYADASKNQVVSGNEVLKITINNVDPKAIWNFAFTVAPMYYYSDAEHIAAFDYVSNFGVEYASQSFMNNVVKNSDKIGVPVGAGPYVASKASGGVENVTSGDFYDKGIVYYEANPYYVMGAPTIKKVQYKVVSSTQVLNALYTKEIDFAEPNAKPEIISELNGKKSEGFANKSVKTSGYGYIGINAGKVPDVEVRRVIMHCINTQECVDYYKTTAQAIYRSMSKANWAYPQGCTSYYPYIGGPVPEDLDVVYEGYADFVRAKGYKAGDKLTEADQKEYLMGLLTDAGYKENADGILYSGNNVLKYTFTIAGEEVDHPAYNALKHASEILNDLGFLINVTTDSNALKKLATGDLTVWAAAWGSTIDPDMYQVYHKDSTATSVLNWGYKQIKANVAGKYDYENDLIEQLSEYIDMGRSTTDEDERARIYKVALDLVMELAIELPTYQRDDLFAYNVNKIDESTLTPDSELSPYKGLMSDLYTVSLNVER